MLPTEDKERKALPIFDGLLMYFPDACVEVARVSKVGNDQHNPGQEMHWAREKSTDQMNTAIRHLMDAGQGNEIDIDGCWHRAKAAWRVLAGLQLAIEKRRQMGQVATSHAPREAFPFTPVTGVITSPKPPKAASAQPCGCDAGANWICRAHRDALSPQPSGNIKEKA
jgi:hypothetical protein